MCQFLSAIVMRNHDVLFNLQTDSHEDLIALHNLRDNRDGNFARVEFHPNEPTDLDKPDKYHLTIDEQRCPGWFDQDLKDKVAQRLLGVVRSMLITGDATCLIGGAYILATGAKVSFIKNCRIVAMLDSSNVGEMLDSSKVGEMRGSSNVGEMRGSSNVGTMWDGSKVGEMRDSSNVGTMWDSSKVVTMLDSSNVGTMWGSSNVGEMRGSSKAPKQPTIDNR